MNIIQQPDSLSLSLNLKEFLITSDVQVSFVLRQGDTEILSQRYDPPTQGYITINLRDIIHGCLSFQLKETGSIYQQLSLVADFTAAIDTTEVSFRVIRSGVDRLSDSARNFLTQNFLTWQPTIKPVTYYSPEFLTYYAVVNGSAKMRAYFTDESGIVTSQLDYTISELVAGIAYTIPLQYSVVAGLLDHKLPAYYDVWIEDISGNRLTYIQRYYAENMRSEQEQWILFENSLGGVDTFRAYGSTIFNGEHTHNIAEVNEVSQEYHVDTERKFEKNTGHLNNDERKWLLDFFPSQVKYIYIANYLRRIVVTESNVNYTDRELPSNYTFTFKYADAQPLLNLPRTDVPADLLNITVPDVGSFTIPPRLAEVPRLPLTEGVLFPVQSPYAGEWGTTTAIAIGNYIISLLTEYGSGGGGVGHQHHNIDLLSLLSYVKGYLLVSGRKIRAGYADIAEDVEGDKYLHKKETDTAQELITFLKGVLIGDNGSGITVLDNGMSQAVVDYLYVKAKAVFDELEVKKKTYVGGEQVISHAGMKCIKVEELADAYRCYFKAKEDGMEVENRFSVGSLAIAQECNIKTGVSQHAGNRYYWRAVTAVGTDYIDLSKMDCDPNVVNDIPAAGDDIVGLGHKTDITRQGAIILSSVNEVAPSIIMYQGIDDFSLAGKEVIALDFDKSTGRAGMRVYGDAYIGTRDRNQYVEFKDGRVNIKGTVHIEPGSDGFENVDGLEFGKVNLLRNSGFTGDYNSAKLESDTELDYSMELYSRALTYWAKDSATVNVDMSSRSGRSVSLDNGYLSQQLYYGVVEGEKYIVSFKARGNNISFTTGGHACSQALTSEYARYVFKFTSQSGSEFKISGTCTVCELQLERGTVPSEWSVSPLDNNVSDARFESLRYLTDVIREGGTDIIGGLILASVLQLGNYKDGRMQKETAGISGVYNHDDDVFAWGGGTMEDAIRTVQVFKDNPGFVPDGETMDSLAKIVLTHGGRAILNDVILRGYIYALGGVFKGTVDMAGSTTHLDADGTGWIGKALGEYFARWDKEGNGSLCFGNIVWDADKKQLAVKGKVEAKGGSKIGNLTINENGALSGGNAVFEDMDMYSPLIPSAVDENGLKALYLGYITDRIAKSTTIIIGGPKISSDAYVVNLPSRGDLGGKGITGGFRLTLVAVANSNPLSGGFITYSARFRVTSRPREKMNFIGPSGIETVEVPAGEIRDNNNNRVEYLDMTQGDVIELYYYGGIYYALNYRT